MAQDRFVERHLGNGPAEVEQMLGVIGIGSVAELIDRVVPPGIQLEGMLDLPQTGMSEAEYAAHIRELGQKNKPLRTLIGMGYYGTATLAAVMRNIFENPAWYTSYTPYQAEISQGRLEALLNFQTAISSLTALPVSNCSLLDEATAAAEAMIMMFHSRSRAAVKEGRNVLLVDENTFPQTIDLLLTRSEPLGIELVVDDLREYTFGGREFGALVQYPGASGRVVDYAEFAAGCHQREVMVTAVADILALALLRAPGEWGADIAVGSTQRLGIPMGFGGPHAGYMAARDQYKRQMPGRIIGVSVDRLGNTALRMALQMREQHIKREKATSNICTAQALLATMAGMFAVYHGAEGLRRIALHAHAHAAAAYGLLGAMGCKMVEDSFFDTLEVRVGSADELEKVRTVALRAGYNLFYRGEDIVHFSFDETSTLADVNGVAAIFGEALGLKGFTPLAAVPELTEFNSPLARESQILTEAVFGKYRNETELMRYIKKLERRDISLANSMISLGSCTMKLNSAASMMPLSLPEWGDVHPFVPAEQAAGYLEMIRGLEHDLAVITGFDAVSLQPNSGAAGEYAGLMVIRAYHHSRGDFGRTIALIPASAHGTNPASAAMAGMEIVTVATDDKGNIDVEDLRAKAAEHASSLSCLMITYPSTHGVFEGQVKQIVEIVHGHGGQVYFDGANMNALVGLSTPGAGIGADVCHLNLHKTFAIPHGGGGPGVGPICVAAHLAPFLPSHPVVAVGGQDGITAVSAAPWGSAMVEPITYGYIKMMGAQGLRRASEMAILSANYMVAALRGHYGIVYSGQTGYVGHEMIVDCREFRAKYGVETGDIARRLMDYGFHAPTLSFPVHDTLMVEPTESEPKAELDRFIAALISIKSECEAIASGRADAQDNVVKMAPHTAAEIADFKTPWEHPYSRCEAAYPLGWVEQNKFWPYVTKIDAGYGDRNLVTISTAL